VKPPIVATTTQRGEITKTDNKKLALRRQSIRTLSDSELRIAHGGGPSVVPVPGTDRPTIGGGTSVIHPSANPSGGFHLNLPNTRVLNPSGGRFNPSGGSIDSN
jgi:hypothetical protein